MREETEEVYTEIENYVNSVYLKYGLEGWSFGWDRARKRLGVCRVGEKRITLSKHFVNANVQDNWVMIEDTVLHEVAHALAWERFRYVGHGVRWKLICREIGAIPRATVPLDMIKPTDYKYALRLKTSGEIVARFYRYPAKTAKKLKYCYVRGRKAETEGQLEIVEL